MLQPIGVMMTKEATYEENLKKAEELGYADAACMACANLSTPASAVCKRCMADTPAFSAAVHEFMRLTPSGSGH
jgi:uncharacterized OB-fold protein